ncbi:hypothetical protein [Ktedonobacter racemifer]|uniref:Uncharacterized protein n=1 Tax=Ktedonobacter racemifer DSM 44963 TaxID=485913 RepID=D6TN62_KTERA|nr:hypothetical protein [Ktedonobacter racemifer]EFH87212.1 hypothetical protein Krac_8541 [Ktedonobacter racemifer DSM 44963]
MKRPVFLTIWLILIVLADLFSLYSYTLGAATITRALPNVPSWAVMLLAILVVVQLVSIALLWMWKKLGFYLYLGSAAIAFVLNILTLGVSGGLTSIFGAVVGAAILYLAMRPVWQNFA